MGKTEKAMAQEKVTFYRHWGETIKELSETERLEVYDAIVQYAFEGVVKDFKSPLARVSFSWIKKDIDTDNARIAEISAKRRNAGRMGGAPKNNQNANRKVEVNEPPPIAENTVVPSATRQGELFPDIPTVPPKEKPGKPKKKHYAELVLMTEAEHQKLVDAYGEDAVQWMITKLDNYKGARGTTYKSDYRAILNWVVKEYEKQSSYGTEEIRRNNTIQQPTAKQIRDAEFANYITEKLASD